MFCVVFIPYPIVFPLVCVVTSKMVALVTNWALLLSTSGEGT